MPGVSSLSVPVPSACADDRLAGYFLNRIPELFRTPKGCLSHPFLVPGGTYAHQLWDWDSFWLAKGMLGLEPICDGALQQRIRQHALGSWMSFFDNQAENGAVPILITPENPDFFGCGQEGVETNQAKPVLAQFALMLADSYGVGEWLESRFEGLIRFLDRWLTYYGAPCGLVVWGSDVAIGVDNDPTTYGRPEFSSANLLLNCLLVRDLQAAMELARRLNRSQEVMRLAKEESRLKAAILAECWDPCDGFFYTVDVQSRDARRRYIPAEVPLGMDMNWKTIPLKVALFTGFLPLWCGIATERQATVLVERQLRASDRFRGGYGMRTLASDQRMYAPEVDSANPSNWLGPVWIVANFMIWEGLRQYGFEAEADDLARRTRDLLLGDLSATGTLHEHYHPDTGRPNSNAGFVSWNILALMMGKAADNDFTA